MPLRRNIPGLPLVSLPFTGLTTTKLGTSAGTRHRLIHKPTHL